MTRGITWFQYKDPETPAWGVGSRTPAPSPFHSCFLPPTRLMSLTSIYAGNHLLSDDHLARSLLHSIKKESKPPFVYIYIFYSTEISDRTFKVICSDRDRSYQNECVRQHVCNYWDAVNITTYRIRKQRRKPDLHLDLSTHSILCQQTEDTSSNYRPYVILTRCYGIGHTWMGTPPTPQAYIFFNAVDGRRRSKIIALAVHRASSVPIEVAW